MLQGSFVKIRLRHTISVLASRLCYNHISHTKRCCNTFQRFWAIACKQFALCYRTVVCPVCLSVCLSCLSVTLGYCKTQRNDRATEVNKLHSKRISLPRPYPSLKATELSRNLTASGQEFETIQSQTGKQTTVQSRTSPQMLHTRALVWALNKGLSRRINNNIIVNKQQTINN